jgi:glucose/arabinose dehydrogenase
VKTPKARGEIWAYGLRNPWKMCFNPADDSLWVGDVGWELWEMIYRIERGGNYGWSLMEGKQPVHSERLRGPTANPPAGRAPRISCAGDRPSASIRPEPFPG